MSASSTLTESAFVELKKRILSTAFKPGEPLRLGQLKKALGIGYTPLREALMRLISEGLVENKGQRGFRVTPVTLETLQDTMQRRIEIEALALTAALEDGREDWEASIVSNFYRLTRRPAIDPETGLIASTWDQAHHSFHHSLIDGCNSHWLKYFWQILFDQSLRYRQIAVTQGALVRNDLAEHQALMDAVLSRNLPATLEASRKHIQSTYNVVLKVLSGPSSSQKGIK